MKVDKKTWYIAHDNETIVHYGVCEIGTNLDSGQPYLEEFLTEQEWLDRLSEFDIEPDNFE